MALNFIVVLFYASLKTWYFCFPRQGMQHDILDSSKYRKRSIFLFTAGDKWNAAKYLTKLIYNAID